MIRKTAIVTLLAFALSSCWEEQQSGPVEIHYGRETGEYCGMIISDPRFAAEVRQAKGSKIYKFDDIGDVIHWLKIASWKPTAETEIWVRDMKTGTKWLDARKVFYVGGQHSPMEYGYGAVAEMEPGAVTYEEMKKAVIAHGSTTRCDTPERAPDNNHDGHTHEDAPVRKRG